MCSLQKGCVAAVLASVVDPMELGGIAQLGEQLLCKHQVVGSIPSVSTNTLEVASAALIVVCVDGRIASCVDRVPRV